MDVESFKEKLQQQFQKTHIIDGKFIGNIEPFIFLCENWEEFKELAQHLKIHVLYIEKISTLDYLKDFSVPEDEKKIIFAKFDPSQAVKLFICFIHGSVMHGFYKIGPEIAKIEALISKKSR